ncbi:lactate utilization protein [Halanaerobium sp. Z-7514]|uniref:Lactate utilization protein n=1 Tax=Halanaerobium polyolivorans TaxID=2886943 RepID=A0AAW4WX58_9FIRM|nr:lactate utilization protein [Halanaerobium polyolivorans]MCC3144458.1 lactate utilization protein [Halanaerobium polyolivorans]RQD71817.1 MAG: lactate utilization protein [Halanaerobium sp. MSAO_Bac5]
METKKLFYQRKAEDLIKKLKQRNMEGYYCDNASEAVAKVMSLIKENSSVSWGGSMSLKEINLLAELEKTELNLIDRSKAKNRAEKEEIYHQALNADYYLMSSNAITQDGKLINIDGTGNRLAALLYGPKNVIIVAGMNKVCIDEAAALKRVKNHAAPENVMRLDKKTPCAKTARCHECQVEDTICCQTVITRRSSQTGRIKLILIGEELGY